MIFDSLMQDYLHSECEIDVELWRAACFKYGLQEDDDFVKVLENTCAELQQISLQQSF